MNPQDQTTTPNQLQPPTLVSLRKFHEKKFPAFLTNPCPRFRPANPCFTLHPSRFTSPGAPGPHAPAPNEPKRTDHPYQRLMNGIYRPTHASATWRRPANQADPRIPSSQSAISNRWRVAPTKSLGRRVAPTNWLCRCSYAARWFPAPAGHLKIAQRFNAGSHAWHPL